jgi:D-sedoheptulose 7-phosphate isomerase
MSLAARREIARYFERSAQMLVSTAASCDAEILQAVDLLDGVVRNGGKIMLCGNGGSAADAQHFSAELVGRLTMDFDRPAIPAVALTTDTSFLTAWSNDSDFSGVFSRQLEAIGRPGDVVIVISTSGRSANLLAALEVAATRDIHSIGLLGCEGGLLASEVDCAIVVPCHETQHIQESHGAIVHLICMLLEERLYRSPATSDAEAKRRGQTT